MTTTLTPGSTAAGGAATDPVTTEIIRCSLNAAADEMNVTLIRSAYTPVIYEMKDCSVALLDARHRVLGQSAGLPIFLGNLEEVTWLTEQTYGVDCWRPGDIWILNDAYLAGTHLHDMTVYGPVFVEDRLVGFAASRAHWLDVGAKNAGSPTDSTDIFQEGLRLGATRVVEGGVERPDMVDLLCRNGRFSYPARGDLYAQIACVRNGQVRLAEIVGRFGEQTLAAARDEIFEQTERLERAAVAALPDGTYAAEGAIDDDGVHDKPVWVRVKVTVAGDEMAIDLTGTDDMAGGPVNCGAAQAVSAARVAYKLLINPDRPVDGGSFRPLAIDVRDGSLLTAVEPAPCEWYFTPLGLLIDLVVKALAEAVPKQAAGASYGDSMVIGIGGLDPRTDEPFLLYEPTVGGWGAWDGCDGQDALINNVNGSLKDVAIEVEETKYPVHMRRYAIRTDSGGAGRWRGGNGVERLYELETDDAWLTLWFERSFTPAWGLFGGRDATGPEVVVNEGRADERRMLKITGTPLARGDTVTTRTGGGGGFGDPAGRDPEAVAADVADRFVSVAAARAEYGQTS
ncbi:MAG: hydantoinase B/oxoprolinase family protein [Streptosporangiaceae bacterium]